METHEDYKPSATQVKGQSGKLKQVHRFLVPVELDGEQHILKLTAKEYDTGKTEVDEISLYDMKYTKQMSDSLSTNSPNLMGRATRTSSSSDVVSVRDMLEGVNDTYDNPYLSTAESYSQSAIRGRSNTEKLFNILKHGVNNESSQLSRMDFIQQAQQLGIPEADITKFLDDLYDNGFSHYGDRVIKYAVKPLALAMGI